MPVDVRGDLSHSWCSLSAPTVSWTAHASWISRPITSIRRSDHAGSDSELSAATRGFCSRATWSWCGVGDSGSSDSSPSSGSELPANGRAALPGRHLAHSGSTSAHPALSLPHQPRNDDQNEERMVLKVIPIEPDEQLARRVTVHFHNPAPTGDLILRYAATTVQATEFAAAARSRGLMVTVDREIGTELQPLPCGRLWS